MREKWMVSSKKADFEGWADAYGISPVTARIIRNRGLTSREEVEGYLRGKWEDLPSPMGLKDMDLAIDLIESHIGRGSLIQVIGDYDVDGICSSHILTRGLGEVGARVHYTIPHRIHDGYGLNDQLILEASRAGVNLIVTCDNGIAAASQVELARSLGMDVIVTDHHEVPFTETEEGRRELLPPANAIVNPKRGEDTYPFKGICGGVVAFKLIQALCEKNGYERRGELLEELVEFAALATVCDVMELLGENRILVKEGLRRLRRTSNPGLRALMEVNGIEPAGISAYHLGFVIGPCLNATGRLDTACRAMELLGSKEKREAYTAAESLKELNETRKNLTLQGVEMAWNQVEEVLSRDKVLVVYLPQVHESLAGIIAGRVRERYNRPTFVLTRSEEGVKGSGRSIEAYHMYEEMVKVSDCFAKFGGHKMAAGLSLKCSDESEWGAEEAVRRFRTMINKACRLSEEDFVPVIHIDVPMPLSYATQELARELEELEPFGTGNPKPLFAQKGLRLVRARGMGGEGRFSRLVVRLPEGGERELVYFGDREEFEHFLDEKGGAGTASAMYREGGNLEIALTYQIAIHTYRGNEGLQFLVKNYC